MRERLPRGFRLGNKGLSGQLALLPGAGGGDSTGSGKSGGAELLGSFLPSSGVRKHPGWAPCLFKACCHPSMLSSAKLELGVAYLCRAGLAGVAGAPSFSLPPSTPFPPQNPLPESWCALPLHSLRISLICPLLSILSHLSSAGRLQPLPSISAFMVPEIFSEQKCMLGTLV